MRVKTKSTVPMAQPVCIRLSCETTCDREGEKGLKGDKELTFRLMGGENDYYYLLSLSETGENDEVIPTPFELLRDFFVQSVPSHWKVDGAITNVTGEHENDEGEYVEFLSDVDDDDVITIEPLELVDEGENEVYDGDRGGEVGIAHDNEEDIE